MTSVSPTVVSATNLDVSLGSVPVLHRVSLQVRPGEAVALLGGNGSGKTTLLRTVLGLVPHDHGEVEWFGTPLHRFKQWHRIGYVPQRATVTMHSTTVTELVGSGTLSRRRPFMPATRAMHREVAEVIERVGLAHKANEAFVHLSGGQQQRVLIARALVSRPDVLVMDEPLAGVDLDTQDRLVNLIAELHADGLTVMVVLHEVEPFANLITRTVTLAQGRIFTDPMAAPGDATVCEHTHDEDPPAGATPILEGIEPWTS